MAALFFLITLAFTTPFPTRAEDQKFREIAHQSEKDDAMGWKPFESFAQYQIRKANNYFSNLNETQKLDLFENWSGADIGKSFSPDLIYAQLSTAG